MFSGMGHTLKLPEDTPARKSLKEVKAKGWAKINIDQTNRKRSANG